MTRPIHWQDAVIIYLMARRLEAATGDPLAVDIAHVVENNASFDLDPLAALAEHPDWQEELVDWVDSGLDLAWDAPLTGAFAYGEHPDVLAPVVPDTQGDA